MEKKSGTQGKSDNRLKNQTSVASDITGTLDDFSILVIHGEKYKTFYTKKYKNRKKWENPDEKLVYSHIPGTVKELFVHEGDILKKGEKLLKLEAMKMLNTIEVPVDGKIHKINVKEGDKIPKGFIMVEFE